jgi:hypothetical protein
MLRDVGPFALTASALLKKFVDGHNPIPVPLMFVTRTPGEAVIVTLMLCAQCSMTSA